MWLKPNILRVKTEKNLSNSWFGGFNGKTAPPPLRPVALLVSLIPFILCLKALKAISLLFQSFIKPFKTGKLHLAVFFFASPTCWTNHCSPNPWLFTASPILFLYLLLFQNLPQSYFLAFFPFYLQGKLVSFVLQFWFSTKTYLKSQQFSLIERE